MFLIDQLPEKLLEALEHHKEHLVEISEPWLLDEVVPLGNELLVELVGRELIIKKFRFV